MGWLGFFVIAPAALKILQNSKEIKINNLALSV